MRYKNFEDIPVWNDGINMTAAVFAVTENPSFRGRGDIANQIQRAALSVPTNIAEGFERGSTSELLQFLYYAKGSSGEVRSICHTIERITAFEHLKSEIAKVRSMVLSISRQLGAWAMSMQESDIRGVRHMTGKSKMQYQQKLRAQVFQADLEEKQEEFMERLRRKREEKNNEI